MAGDEWTMIADFAAMPVTEETRSALLAKVPLQRLLEMLAAGGRMDILCQCLEKVLGSAEADSRRILKSEDGARLLPRGLGHPDELVRLTSVRVAAGLVDSDEDLAWLESHNLVFGLVCATTDTSLAVANAACNALVKAVARTSGVAAVFAADCCEEMQARMCDSSAGASVIRMRVLELMCRMWAVSAAAAERCKALGAKQQLLVILEGADILLQLNAVEVLAYIPPTDIGEELLSQLLTTAEEYMGSGAVPARLLSCVASFVADQHDMVSSQLETRLCAILAERLSNERPGTDGTVDMLCTLAILCATSRGLAALVRSSQFAPAATHLALNMRGQHQASKLAVLSFIENAARSSANLIIENSEHASAAAATLQQTLTPLVADVLKLTRTQIMEERVGALCACCSLAMLRWGVQALFAQADFLSFIVDRQEEASKRALEAKYACVRNALAHSDIAEVVGAQGHQVLVAYAADGAFYTSRAARENGPQIGTMGAG